MIDIESTGTTSGEHEGHEGKAEVSEINCLRDRRSFLRALRARRSQGPLRELSSRMILQHLTHFLDAAGRKHKKDSPPAFLLA